MNAQEKLMDDQRQSFPPRQLQHRMDGGRLYTFRLADHCTVDLEWIKDTVFEKLTAGTMNQKTLAGFLTAQGVVMHSRSNPKGRPVSQSDITVIKAIIEGRTTEKYQRAPRTSQVLDAEDRLRSEGLKVIRDQVAERAQLINGPAINVETSKAPATFAQIVREISGGGLSDLTADYLIELVTKDLKGV